MLFTPVSTRAKGAFKLPRQITRKRELMKILLYNPDNGVTRNFMPHLWMFLLQTLTPPGHEVTLVDGNARAMTEEELVRFVRERGIELVGIGAMTRMVARGYRFADALRAAGVKVVMGGPHVTECPGEALGRDGLPLPQTDRGVRRVGPSRGCRHYEIVGGVCGSR